jgi:hypothetical protein
MRTLTRTTAVLTSLLLLSGGCVPSLTAFAPSSSPCDPNEAVASEQDERVGYEIMQIVSANEIIAWGNFEMTQCEFDALDLPFGWFKNQPRESMPDAAMFFSSPTSTVEGELVTRELFGHTWTHLTTITQANIALDDQGLLTGSTVVKEHQLTFNAGATLWVLFSPEGDAYVMVTRDAQRTSDTPTIPAGWDLVEYTTPNELVFQLPAETLVIRADNEDSFQGPVLELNDIH